MFEPNRLVPRTIHPNRQKASLAGPKDERGGVGLDLGAGWAGVCVSDAAPGPAAAGAGAGPPCFSAGRRGLDCGLAVVGRPKSNGVVPRGIAAGPWGGVGFGAILNKTITTGKSPFLTRPNCGSDQSERI